MVLNYICFSVMKTITTKKELQEYRKKLSMDSSIGFVPTMGALHEGHLSLLDKSNAENDISIVSIFINPAQFNDVSDFNNYPRNFEHDKLLLAQRKCDILFLPEHNEIYPDQNIDWIDVDLGFIEQTMEGRYRSGHFRGVKTVVFRLFDIVKPHKAYFGEKDYQQMLIVKEMEKKLHMLIQIIPCETQRDDDGLAMSSRNRKLTVEGRRAAAKIPLILKAALNLLKTESPGAVSAWVKEQFAETAELQLQYFEIVDQETLKSVARAEPEKTRLFVAVFVDNVRLIDNMLFKELQ